ncbi:ABC transporter ATP-binding protein [Rheinheimera maricola]|uniref:ABC transporter ATP-binding protein n=1 Tax=Rheinheimera maricola TaxID=2793282 RepID=A0ABS7X5R6_9GAMM|nr:ABC transporter ATP-binding protein [Rheinheimera maricola]MBZ9610893.1 ABC transporter ATP-binding protein [Rheinheimera maricola]
MLNVSAVSLSLGGQAVLHDINFALTRGEFVGVIGPNGAGKSSLLRVLHREHVPQSGKIILKHKSLQQFSAVDLARTVAVVSQSPPPLFALSVQQVATMGLLPHKSWFQLNSSHDIKQISLALDKVGLKAKTTQAVDTLSGGELQRLHIARALVQQPALLLLDEPTNHLDVQYQHQVLQLVRSLAIPALACLHDLNLAALYCDKILLLDKGRQIAFGSPEQVLQSGLIQQVFGVACDIAYHPQLKKLQVTFLPHLGLSTC